MELRVIKNEGLYYTVQIKYNFLEKAFGFRNEIVNYKLFGTNSLIDEEGNLYLMMDRGVKGKICSCVYEFKSKQENKKLYNLG